MSSILKALKKLEDDNATRRPAEFNIDAEIVRSGNPPRLSPTLLLITSLLLLAGGSGVTYMYMKNDRTPASSPPKPHLMTRQDYSQFSASDIKSEQLPEAPVVVPAKQQNIAKTNHIPKQRQSSVIVPVDILKPAKSLVASKPTPEKGSLPHPLPAAAIKNVPALRVNGIAFQEGGADSVAMINGEPFSSGAVIDGVKIEEVLKNKVRFSYNGEQFEILMGQSNF